MLKGGRMMRVHVPVALAALWLSACGGGGSDGEVPAPPQQPLAQAPAPATAPPPAAAAPSPQALSWTAAQTAPDTWHWVASNAAGDVMVAGANPGQLFMSTDGGSTWSPTNAPEGNWISVDMTPDGQRMIAAQYGGGLFVSSDRGQTWTQATSSAVNMSGREFQSVTISADGQAMAAAILNGEVLWSADGGASWAYARDAALPATSPALTGAFRAIGSSADGSIVVVAGQDNSAYLSTNGGATFRPIAVSVDGAAVTDRWYRLAVSADGNTIAMAANTRYSGAGTGIYVSRDRGATWTQATTEGATYTSLTMSVDGGIIGATVSNDPNTGATGRVLLSIDGGQSFAPLTAPAGDTNWRAIAFNRDASRAVLASGTFLTDNGRVYTSSGSITGR